MAARRSAHGARRCAPVPKSRKLHRTVVTTFGADFATVSTEFTSDATPLLGRQMQTWARLGPADGWKIVAAHVSLIDPAVLS